MKLVDFDPTDIDGARAAPSIPLSFTLADDSQLTVWLTNLKTQVVGGVLTATGTATLPGQDSDTFTAQVRGHDTSTDRVVLRIAFGAMKREPIEFPIDVSPLRGANGGLSISSLLNLLTKHGH